MRFIIYIILIFFSFLLQTTLFNNILILDIKPNLILILIVSFAFMRGELDGALIGFFCGFLMDMFFSTILGVNALIGLIVGYFAGKLCHSFYKNSILTPLVLTIFSTIIYNLLFYIINILLKGYPNIFYFIKTIIFPETIYTVIISIPIYRVFYFINSHLESFEKSRRKLFK